MSKFKAGDKVRIVSLTDIDDKTKVLRSNEEAYKFDPSLGGMIGATATVKEYLNDYYDLVITMDEPNENYPEFDEPAMLERDLEKVTLYAKITSRKTVRGVRYSYEYKEIKAGNKVHWPNFAAGFWLTKDEAKRAVELKGGVVVKTWAEAKKLAGVDSFDGTYHEA
jgi:hypothetical protein